jgi:hypothetical protein
MERSMATSGRGEYLVTISVAEELFIGKLGAHQRKSFKVIAFSPKQAENKVRKAGYCNIVKVEKL